MIQNDSPRPLLSVRRLRVYHRQRGLLRRSRTVKAIDDLHFDLRTGEILAVVGEAGSGKSTLAAALLGQIAVTAGSIAFSGRERVGLSAKTLATVDAGICGIAQAPLAVQGRRVRVERLFAEAFARLPVLARRERIAALLVRVGLSPEVAGKRLVDLEPPARVRVMLARALAVDPQLVICDGPADELDAAARAELLETLVRLQQSVGFALVVMAREFGDIASFARRVLVLSLGRTLEQGPVDTVVRMPAHPYSRRLLALASGNTVEERTEEGELLSDRETPSSANPPMGCVFHTRCSLVERSCVQSVPLLKRTTGVEHYAACHFAPVPS